jgi:hypothetical protein
LALNKTLPPANVSLTRFALTLVDDIQKPSHLCRRVPRARLMCQGGARIMACMPTTEDSGRAAKLDYLLRAILPRSRQRPVAVTEGSLTNNLNKNGVRFWTDRCARMA